MNTPLTLSDRKITVIFWSMLAIHLIAWTLLPVLIRHAVSNDIIEVITWGHQFEWGYDKNPWLPAVLASLGIKLGGNSGIGIYFIQQLFVLLGLWSIWRLTLTLSPPHYRYAYALIASMMLEGCVCYTLNVQLYNDNYILLGLWPFSAWLFYHLLQTNAWRYWISLSVVLGLATMAKYDTVIIVGIYGLYLLLQYKYWHFLVSIKPWLSLLVYCTILLPNLVWLYHHQFISLNYAFVERAQYQQQDWWDHYHHIINFIIATLINFLPAFLLLLTGLSFNSSNKNCSSTNELNFVFMIGVAPFLILLIIACFLGLDLANEWGMTLIGFWGTCLLLFFQPSVTQDSLKRFIIIIYCLLLLWPLGYMGVSFIKDTGNYPGPEIASYVTRLWHQRYGTRLAYVGGSRYVAGYVGFYSPDKPAVWMEWNEKVSPWIDVNDLRCHGGIFIQDSGHTVMEKNLRGLTFPSQILQAFPNLEVLPPQPFPWFRNHTHQSELLVLIGLIPPSPNCVKK